MIFLSSSYDYHLFYFCAFYNYIDRSPPDRGRGALFIVVKIVVLHEGRLQSELSYSTKVFYGFHLFSYHGIIIPTSIQFCRVETVSSQHSVSLPQTCNQSCIEDL